MSEGFIGRWSRRKVDVREGKAVGKEPAGVNDELPPPQPSPKGGGSNEFPPPPLGEGRGGGTLAEQQPPPTLEDVKLLTPESDFTRFVKSGVAPDVKNAAVKKLFADPRFNVMDGLDVYTGDYSQPDPMPQSMLEQLAATRFLKVFEARDDADDAAAQSVAQSAQAPEAVPPPDSHDDPDLRLQQDDAAAGEDPGRGDR